MFKLAALTATVSASAFMEEMEQTAELFTIRVKEQEVNQLEEKTIKLEGEQRKFTQQFQMSQHPQKFQQEFQALVQTKEFVNIAKYMDTLKKQGPTPQIRAFAHAYKKQLHKLEISYKQLEQTTSQHVQVQGPRGNQRAAIEVDNDQWYEFNKEYYKTRELEYYAMYKIPEIAKLRSLVTALRKTTEMGAVQTHWAEVTKMPEHQQIVKHEAELLVAFLKTVHINASEQWWVDPKNSPVLFDALHAIYLYFVAVGKGDLNPLLDFVIDGKYDANFVKEVKPVLGKHKENNLYLF